MPALSIACLTVWPPIVIPCVLLKPPLIAFARPVRAVDIIAASLI